MSSDLDIHLGRVIRGYLESNQFHRSWVTASDPLTRRVEIRGRTWEPWVSNGGHVGRSSFCGPLPPASAGVAVELLKSLPRVAEPARGRDRYVDRTVLQELAGTAGSSLDDESLIRLWVATMMWGSGTSNGRGPWRTAQGLSSPALSSVLSTTAEAVLGNDLAAAHERFGLDGTGEAFFTKWFWSVSLSEPAPKRRPLILDQRVHDVLRHTLGQEEGWTRPRGPHGYSDFVDLVHRCASDLQHDYRQIDAEKIEWLMFDRRNHRRVPEPCFAGWSN